MSARKQVRTTDRHVGKRIRMRRLMMKMGQTELGRRLGLTAMAVSKYERGEIRIGASRLQEISTILQVTPAFFFEPTSTRVQRKTMEEKRRWPDHVTDLMATPDGLALAKAFAEIKDLGASSVLSSTFWQRLSVLRDRATEYAPAAQRGAGG